MNSTVKSEFPTVAVLSVVLLGGAGLTAGAAIAGGHAVWFAARATGLTAYVLATGSVLFGLASATRSGNPKPGLGVVADIHRALSLLTLVAIGGHVLFLALDQYARFGPTDLLVPFATWYRPVWTGLGIVAAYLAVAVFASFYVRSYIGYRVWRAFHYASFGIFALATLHGLLSGADSGALWARMLYAGSTGAVALMLAYRLSRGSNPQPAWAWEETSGDLGAARGVLAIGVLCAAFVLPLWVLAAPPAGTASSGQPTAAVAAGSPSSGDSGGATQSQADQRGQGQEQEQTDTASVMFAGSAQAPGSWRLLSETSQPIELDLAPPGVLSLRDPSSGQMLFQSQENISVSEASGTLRSMMDGYGNFSGYTLSIDGSYRSSGGQIQLAAQLTIFGGTGESGQ